MVFGEAGSVRPRWPPEKKVVTSRLRTRQAQHWSHKTGPAWRISVSWFIEIDTMNPALFLFGAFIIGFASGLRAFTPAAIVCWAAVWGWIPLAGSHLAFLGRTTGAVVASILAVGELIADKLPMTPSRLSPGPLGGRVIMSSLAGTALAIGTGHSWVLGVVAGALGSIAGAFSGFHIRRAVVSRLGIADWPIAMAEDILTVGLVLLVFALLF